VGVAGAGVPRRLLPDRALLHADVAVRVHRRPQGRAPNGCAAADVAAVSPRAFQALVQQARAAPELWVPLRRRSARIRALQRARPATTPIEESGALDGGRGAKVQDEGWC
jgi:hypothetical protein